MHVRSQRPLSSADAGFRPRLLCCHSCLPHQLSGRSGTFGTLWHFQLDIGPALIFLWRIWLACFIFWLLFSGGKKAWIILMNDHVVLRKVWGSFRKWCEERYRIISGVFCIFIIISCSNNIFCLLLIVLSNCVWHNVL